MASAVPYAVDIVGVSKTFQRKVVGRGYSSLKSLITRLFQSKENKIAEYKTHPVLSSLTIRIPKGASMGVIGRNGAGKSTLLKLITGIYKPTQGSISLNGRVAALIELGAGFHPDFSGRENVYLAGIMQGMTRKEIDRKFEDIVAFAELDEVIDEPVRTYSSGMFMRLGFSVAVHTDPDVLLVDEVLAVGDARFVAKCKDRLAQLRKENKTLVLVTHDLDAVERWCDEVIWLHEGAVKDRGDPRRVIDHYRQWVEKKEELELLEHIVPTAQEQETQESSRWGSREVELTSVNIFSSFGEEKRVFHPEETIVIKIGYRVNEKTTDVVFGVAIKSTDGKVFHGTNTELERYTVPVLQKEGIIEYTIKENLLLDGRYHLDVASHRQDGYPYDYHQNALEFSVRWSGKQVGVYLPHRAWRID